jgi:hypothetical protein
MEFQVILRALKSLGLGVGLRVSQYSFTREELNYQLKIYSMG